jgi:PAS domain S-box-containing protein
MTHHSTSRAILQVVSDGIDFSVFTLDSAYRYTHFNRAHAAMMKNIYGVEIEIGGALNHYQTAADWQETQPYLDRALAGEIVVKSSYAGDKLFARRFFDLVYRPIEDEAGTILGVAVFAQDNTKQDPLAEAIRLSERRFRALIEKSADAITLLDANGIITYDSPSAPGLLGYDPDELIGDSAFELIHPEDRPKIQALLQELVATPGGHAHTTFRLRHKSGRYMWMEGTGTNLLADPGVEALVINYRDITERMETEQQLRESETRFRQVWETTSDAMAISDAEGIVLAVNPAYLQLYGYPEADIVGNDFAIIFPPQHRAAAREEYARIFASEFAPPIIESQIRRADGSERYVETQVTFLTANGKRTALLSTIRDITERKAAVEALWDSNRQLETALLELQRTQDQLVRQERLAAVGQLSAGIAHDFNNILSVVLLHIQIAQRMDDASPLLRKRLDMVAGQAQRAADLVQQILDFSRSTILQPRNLDVWQFFQQHVETLRREMPANIHIALQGDRQPITIEVDPARVQQLLTNLALNARDAMPQGGDLQIELRVISPSLPEGPSGELATTGAESHLHKIAPHLLPDLAGETWLEITVRDTGCGIPRATLGHIFEPFFTTKQPGQGTGLGLAQVYGIVKQHQGHMDVQSEVGIGSTFKIYLPIAAGDSAPMSSAPGNSASLNSATSASTADPNRHAPAQK